METGSAEIDRRWRAWLVERNRRGLRVALTVGLILYPSFGLLDWAMAPRHALAWVWATRATITIVTIALFAALRSPSYERWGEALSAAYAWVAAAGIAVMTTYMGGLASPYYAGISLVVLAGGLLMVWHPRVIVVTNAAIVATFLAANAAVGAVGPLSTALSNLAFLCATALVAGLGQMLLFRTLRVQHGQRVRLERTTANLERAHEELKQLDQFKSRFFANMTHELRTPLAMVLTPLELLLQGEMGTFTDPQKSSFQSMYRSALKLLKLINDLLDLSRLEESRLRLVIGEHDLVANLRQLIEHTEVLAQRKNIALELRVPPHVERATLRCDIERLERVFVNLLSNAIKFTPAGGHVVVCVDVTEAAVLVTVEDDGPGFPPADAPRLFERFYQVDMAGTRQHGGTGIGLALARELVVLHGGGIEAASDGKSGARFTVTLPRDLPAPVADAGRSGVAAEPRDGDAHLDWAVELEGRRDFRLIDIEEAAERRVIDRDVDEEARPYTAVVVEDNPQIVRLVHMSLRRDFKVLAAGDGAKGLELVLRERPSLVVTDLMMPGMDGLELTQRLRTDDRTKHIPVLMLTARGTVDDRVKGLETGVSAYLTKPFSPRELVTCARGLVHAKEQTADLVLTHRMESVEIVAAGLAHEINNPLNYVKNSLARVRMDAEKVLALAHATATRSLAPQEHETLERAAGRIGELLTVADSGLKRIAGTVELMGRYGRAGFRREIMPHDAWGAVRDAVAVVLPATGRAVKVDVELEGDGTLECVPEEFNQVVTNLVQNAIEAVADGTGAVRVSGSVDGDALVLSVKDNGPGIPAHVQAKLFTPFFTTKGPGRGMGLGLTITRRVVQGLHGTLQVSSAPGAGTEFTVRVPLVQEAKTTAPTTLLRATK